MDWMTLVMILAALAVAGLLFAHRMAGTRFEARLMVLPGVVFIVAAIFKVVAWFSQPAVVSSEAAAPQRVARTAAHGGGIPWGAIGTVVMILAALVAVIVVTAYLLRRKSIAAGGAAVIGIGTGIALIVGLVVYGLWYLWSLYSGWEWFWGFAIWPSAEEHPTALLFAKLIVLALILIPLGSWVIGKFKAKKETPSTDKKATKIYESFYGRQKAQGWHNMPFFYLRPFYAGAVQRLGEYTRVLRPGEYAILDGHGIILRYAPRFLQWLGGFYFKWPWIEKVDVVYIGTRSASRLSLSINSAGAAESEQIKAVFEELADKVPIGAGKELATAQGPQTQVRFFMMYEVHQVITALRLNVSSYDRPTITRRQEGGQEVVEVVDDFLNLAIMPNVNSFMQDTLPDMLQGDIQRTPSEILLAGTRNEIKARVPGRGQLRGEAAVQHWDDLLHTEPFKSLDPGNLDSPLSRRVVEELRKDEPYGIRERKNCLLVNIMDACGIRLRQFKKEEAEPEPAIRAKITEKGQAQMDVEIRTIKARAKYAEELIAQQERVASARTDAEKVNVICDVCKLGEAYKPYLVAFFQQQRTREVMSKGTATTFVIGEEMLGQIGNLLERLKPTLGK